MRQLFAQLAQYRRGLTNLAAGAAALASAGCSQTIDNNYYPRVAGYEPVGQTHVEVLPRHQTRIVCEWGRVYLPTGGRTAAGWWASTGYGSNRSCLDRDNPSTLPALRAEMAARAPSVYVYMPKRNRDGSLMAGESPNPVVMSTGRGRIQPVRRNIYRY